MAIVKELVISRLSGQDYPSQEIEDDLLRKYFLKARYIQLDLYVLIFSINNNDSNEKRSYFDYLIPEIVLLPYKIVLMKDDNLNLLESGETSPSTTNVILQPNQCYELLIPYPELFVEGLIAQYSEIVQSCHIPCHLVLRTPGVTLDHSTGSTRTQDPFLLSITSHVVDENTMNGLKIRLSTYLGIWQEAITTNPLSFEVYRILKSRQLITSTQPLVQLESRKLGILIDKSNVISEDELALLLEDCCLYSGLSFYRINSKLLTIAQGKLKELTSGLRKCSKFLQYLSKEQFQSSSVVFISNFDDILQKPVQTSAVVPADTPEDLFQKHFSTAINELGSTSVQFVAYSNPSLQKSPSLKSYFPIQLSTEKCEESLTTDLIKQLLMKFSFQTDKTSIILLEELSNKLIKDRRSLNTFLSACYQNIEMNTVPDAALKGENYLTRKVLNQVLRSLTFTSPEVVNKAESDRFSASQTTIAPVYWEDIGGLESVRRELLDVLELPYKHSEFFPANSPRRIGILLYGPPGTGKTLVAKAVATECKMSFLSIKGPELLDSYVGESEKNIRDLFHHALQKSPCVMFFDEIDSIAPARARGNDSGGGVMDRMVSQFLTEMDELRSSDKKVFIIAATNRPDLLDPALLRPGRFDRRIFLGVSKGIDAKVQILKSQLRKFSLAEEVDLIQVAQLLPDSVTGADIGSVSSMALNIALSRKIEELNRKFDEIMNMKSLKGDNDKVDESNRDRELRRFVQKLSKGDQKVVVAYEDFQKACAQLKPTIFDGSHYEELQQKFENI